MKIVKQAQGGEGAVLTEGDLEQISGMARRPMKAEELYTFSVRLCDNEIDRDMERFAPETLEELAGLFVGKSGIFDHQWSSRGQAARIYKTEVVRELDKLTGAGDPYCWLKGYAYMVRTEGNRDLIAEIEAGIKKEVSVGCSVERAVCSVCGGDRNQTDCGHEKGKEYGGQLCYAVLEGARDAYEFSFVAVPAQPMAGVVKGAAEWKALARGDSRREGELEKLKQEAELGRTYLKWLRSETVRMALLSDGALDGKMVKAIANKLSPEELQVLRESFARRVEKRYPVKPQLTYQAASCDDCSGDQAFLV